VKHHFKIGICFILYFFLTFGSRATDHTLLPPEKSKESLESILKEAKTFNEAIQKISLHWRENCVPYAQKVSAKLSLNDRKLIMDKCLKYFAQNCEEVLKLTGWVQYSAIPSYPIEGWKFHISATSQSALKIARVILPVLKKWQINYKIAPSSDFLATQLTGTQKGKFITIYPPENNLKEIAIDLNHALLSALKGKILQRNDFESLTGDAMLGSTGGLYVRYGNLYGSKKKTVQIRSASRQLPLAEDIEINTTRLTLSEPNDLEKKLVQKWVVKNYGLLKTCQEFNGAQSNTRDLCIQDDRNVPWPNFMNDRSLWPSKHPFGKLELSWCGITWKDRPSSWKELKNKAEYALL
jgi:hypothetical protein